MPDKSPLQPEIFQFTNEELIGATPELTQKLVPLHVRSAATTSSSVSGVANGSQKAEVPPTDA